MNAMSVVKPRMRSIWCRAHGKIFRTWMQKRWPATSEARCGFSIRDRINTEKTRLLLHRLQYLYRNVSEGHSYAKPSSEVFTKNFFSTSISCEYFLHYASKSRAAQERLKHLLRVGGWYYRLHNATKPRGNIFHSPKFGYKRHLGSSVHRSSVPHRPA